MNPKKWWQSRLVWLGILQVVIGASDFVASQMDLIKVNGWLAVFPLASGIATVILRVVTTRPIAK